MGINRFNPVQKATYLKKASSKQALRGMIALVKGIITIGMLVTLALVFQKKVTTGLVLLNLSLIILSHSTLPYFYFMLLHFRSLHARLFLTLLYFNTGLHLTG